MPIDDPWTSFLKEELIRAHSTTNLRETENHSAIVSGDSDDHETVVVANKKTLATPSRSVQVKIHRTPETLQERETPPNSPPLRPIVIDTRDATSSTTWSSCLGRYKGLIIAAVLIYILIATGFGGYLLQQFLGIPSLNREITQLTQQVDRLQQENEILQKNIQDLTLQVDRQEKLNAELASNATLLRTEVNQTQVLIQVLNSSLTVKEQLNNQLKTQLVSYQKSLVDANNTLIHLEALNENLDNQVDSMKIIMANYSNANKELEIQLTHLTSSTIELSDTVLELNSTIQMLQKETETLQELNANLGTVVSFLNVTNNQNTQVYQDFIGYLSNQIVVYRGLVSEDLELYYRYFVDNWSCDFTSRFGNYAFGINDTVPFGSSYSAVMTRIYNKDLGYLCINQTDFELFLVRNILPMGSTLGDTTLVLLEEAVSQYSANVLEYYFPTDSSIYGLTIEHWENSTWTCNNLPSNLRFNWDKVE